jgi:succinoglycan biosynthesis transport protein ExoP
MSSETRLVTVTQPAGRLPAEPSAPTNPLTASRPRVPDKPAGFSTWIAIRAVRRHWFLAAVLGAVFGFGGAAAVWKFLPSGRQSSSVVLHISDQQPFVSQATPEGQVNAAVYRQRQLQAVTSIKVLETALDDPAVADLAILQKANPVGELERRIKTDFKLGQEFMRITVETDSADESLILVTAIKNAYLSEVVNKERGIWYRSVARREEALRDMEAVYERNRAELARKLEPFNLKPADAAFIPRLRQFAEEKHQQKESELRQVQARLRTLELEEKSDAEEDQEKIAVTAAAVDEELDREPPFVILRAKTVALEQELTVNTSATKSDSTLPAIVKLRKDVEVARQAEADYRKSARPRIEARLAERQREKRRAEGLTRKREMDRYRDWQTALEGDIKQAKAEAIRLSGASVEIEAIGQTVARHEKQIAEDRDAIARQRREVEIAPPRVSEHEPPRVNSQDEFRRRLKYSGLAGLAGLGLVVTGLVGIERFRNRISDANQVVDLTLPILGTLPNLDPSHHIIATRGAEWPIAVEAIDTVRTMLLHSVGSTGPKVIMVASAAPGEGKTTLTGCLAESLARAGYRTLLIDGDLRRPTAHTRYRTPPGPGVAQILRGETSVRTCCYVVADRGFWVLPSGQNSAAAGGLLPKGGWWALIQEAREQFDFVVVDTSPILSVVDPILMAPACDGVVLAVLRDVSRMDLLSDAVNRLRTLGIPILGCVVHRAYRPPIGDYYYSPMPNRIVQPQPSQTVAG